MKFYKLPHLLALLALVACVPTNRPTLAPPTITPTVAAIATTSTPPTGIVAPASATPAALTVTSGPATTTPGVRPTPTLEPFVPGIYTSKAAPEPSANHTMTNWWQDLVNGERVQVFAGALQDNTIYPPGPAQGLVVVNTIAIDVVNSTLQEYDAPSGTGVLTITAVSGSRLTLQSHNGGTLYFDVPTRQFVDSLSTTSTAPTATLLPTILPDIEAPSQTAVPYPYPQPT